MLKKNKKKKVFSNIIQKIKKITVIINATSEYCLKFNTE